MIKFEAAPTREEMALRIKAALDQIKKAGYKTEQVAAALHMSWHSVHAWEKGGKVPRLPVIEKIERLFEIKTP